MRLILLMLSTCLLLLSSVTLRAQIREGEDAGEDVSENKPSVENIRFDYAQVLNVSPVYKNGEIKVMQEQCSPEQPAEVNRLSRLLDSVKGVFTHKPQPLSNRSLVGENCQMVEIEQQVHHIIAYDVDYVYKGAKFRSRLQEDPGNRLLIRISITPELSNQLPEQ